MLKKLFSKKQIRFFFYTSCLLLILIFNFKIRRNIKTWKLINQDIISLYSKANCYFLKKKYNEPFINSGDFSSILTTLNSMNFLSQEKQILEEHVSNPNFIENKFLKKRLDFISSPVSNKMTFLKRNLDAKGVISFELTNPIELDLNDFLSVLSVIENSYYQKIPYFISELEINRNQAISKQEVWKLTYKLLKRCI